MEGGHRGKSHRKEEPVYIRVHAHSHIHTQSGFKMSTYAVNWIRQELQRAQNEHNLVR